MPIPRCDYNPVMPAAINDIMEQASVSLVKMDYLTCEALCLEALGAARAQRDWPYYARILLPLQEARRQRRMIAAEGRLRLGTATLTGTTEDWLRAPNAGCIVVTQPHTADTARALDRAARDQRLHVEVLFADNASSDDTWTLRSFRGPAVSCTVAAPPAVWRDRDLTQRTTQPINTRTPADWFIDATESLGDAALASLAPAVPEQLLPLLESCLDVVTDHEIIHQRLGSTARALTMKHNA